MKTRISNPFRSGISAVLTVLTLGCFTASSALAATRTWDGGNVDPVSAGQWNVSSFANWDAAIVNGDDLVFGTTNPNGWTLTSVGAARTIKSLTFQSGSPAYDIRLASTVTGGTTQSLTFNATNTGITVEAGDTSSHNIGLALGSLVLQGNLTTTHNGSGTLTISRPITGAGFGLTKEGTGTMKLSGVNTYDGATQVNAGILTIGNLAAKGTTSGITVAASGIIGLGLDNASSTTLYIPADLAALFNRLSADPALIGNVAGYSLDDASGVAVDTTGAAFSVDQGAGNALTAPNRNLIKIGTGALRLNQTNTYTGATIIKEGTLSLGAGLNGGLLSTSSAITVESGATFAVDKNNAAVQGTAFSVAPITGDGNFSHTGGNAGTGVTTLNAANTFTGTTTSSGGLLTLSDSLALQNSALNTTGSIASSSATTGLKTTVTTLTLGGLSGNKDLATLFDAANGYSGVTNLTLNPQTGKSNTYTGIIADGAAGMSLTKTGPGTQTLSGANTYTGATTLSEGTLILNNATALGGDNPGVNGTSSISMAAGTTLRSNYIIVDTGNVDSFVHAPITLSGSGSVNFLVGAGSAVAPAEAVTFNLNGVIDGTAGTDVVFSTTGSLNNPDSTFVLGAASTYDGNTTITVGNTTERVNVKAGVINALPSTTVLTLDGGTGSGTGRVVQYDLNGNNQTLAGLQNVTGLSLRHQRVNNTGALATLTVNNSDPYTFGGTVITTSTTKATIQGAISLVKSGAGTFTLIDSQPYTGTTTIAGGTLALGTSNVLPSTAVSIGAGTLDVGAGFTDTVGTLDCTGAAVINLGTGATLVFSDSNLVDWTDTDPDGTLNITGDFNNTSIKFATSGGLTSGQLAVISVNGSGTGTYTLDDSGYLVAASVSGFADWQTANGTAGGLDQDHDNDGVSNGVEYFIYGPVANSGFTALPGVTDNAGTLSVTWTYAAGYTGTYDTDFVVEVSSTLGSWVAAPSGVTFPDANSVKYTFPAGTKNFARLKVTGP